LSNETIKKCIDEYVLGLFDNVICWICEENIECKNEKGYDYVFDKELAELLKESDDDHRYNVDKKRIEELSLKLIEANPNGDIYEMMNNHYQIFGFDVDPDMLYSALERNLNNIPDNEKPYEKEIKKHNLRELVKFKDKLVYLHNLNDYQINSLEYNLTRQLIHCGCSRGNSSNEARKIQDEYGDSPFSEKGRYNLSKKDLTINEILTVFNIMFALSSDGIHPIWENAIINGTIKNFLINIENQLITY